jgi:hypothetical protein
VTGVIVACVIGGYFTPQYGLNAMAWAVGIGLALASAIPMLQLNLHDDLHPFEAPFASVMARAAGVAVVGAFVTYLIPMIPLLGQRLIFALMVLAALRLSWKVALGLAVLGASEWLLESQVAVPDQLRARLVTIMLLLPILVASLWASLRLALPKADRLAIGEETARKLRLA